MVWLDDVDSTNSYVVARLHNLPHGLFVAAVRQRAGRGRLGRPWHAPPGNICLTAAVKPPWISPTDDLAGFLTLSIALSVCDVLDALGVPATLKWPNDVRVGGQKIGGVLAQAVWHGERFVGAAVGVGVNVNMSEEELRRIDQPATSLRVLTGEAHDERALAQEVAARFLKRIAAPDRAVLRREVLRRLEHRGETVTVCTPRGAVVGRAVGVDGSFSLVVADGQGGRRSIRVGELP